ncbi:MAG: RodZ domain-containing protein, partial [bacterium]
QMELAPAMESTPLADKLILPTATDNIKNRVAPIELQIKANDKVWIQFTVDDKTVSKYFLSPEEHLIWTAENNFDILFANTGEIRFTLNGKEINKLDTMAETVRLTFTKNGQVE